MEDALRVRLETAQAQTPHRRAWLRKCNCVCNCDIQHSGRKPTCVLCRDGDCWHDLDSYLAKIGA